jgi:AbrB family transcriptional regulator, stage V sporulation protein T
MSYQAKIIKGGKIVIPVELRRELGFKDGDTLVVEKVGNSVVFKTYEQVIREVQARVKSLIKTPFTVDDYLVEKYREAETE